MKIIKLIALVTVMCVSLGCQNNQSSNTTQSSEKSMMKDTNTAIPKISVQLWSVKNELKADFKGTLTKISNMGFEGVEFAGDFGPYKNDAHGLKRFLDSVGLQVSAAHIKFPAFTDENFKAFSDFYKTIGTDTLIIAWDDRAWDAAQFDSLITDFNTMYSKLKAAGFRFGFHNHDQEFNAYKGSTFWDQIAQSTPNDFILQMDAGWVTYAGKDPVTYINRYAGRTLTTHIKAKIPKALRAEAASKGKRPIIGDDITDWAAVLKADIAVGGTKWFVVEQEEYPDGLTPLQAVELSKKGLDKIISNL